MLFKALATLGFSMTWRTLEELPVAEVIYAYFTSSLSFSFCSRLFSEVEILPAPALLFYFES
jgi:hypothetical protein